MDHFIPVSRNELIAALSSDIDPDSKAIFAKFCRLYTAVLHYRFHEICEQIKTGYMPYAPDNDLILKAAADDQALSKSVELLESLLVKANYEALSETELNTLLAQRPSQGVEVKVDLEAFTRLRLFARGKSSKQIIRRHWYAPWKSYSQTVSVIPRLYMLLQFDQPEQPKRRFFGKEQATDKGVHLKLFKDIPISDLEMLFPNSQIKLSRFDKLKLGLTSGGGTAGGAFATIGKVAAAASPITILIAIGGFAGLLARQIGKVFNQRTRYMMKLAQHLYFHNQANNLGVVSRIVDMAEEEEAKEALLAYGMLLIHGPLTPEKLDAHCETWLKTNFAVGCDFDVDDALNKLVCDQLAKSTNGEFFANPISDAVHYLDSYWDNLFSL